MTNNVQIPRDVLTSTTLLADTLGQAKEVVKALCSEHSDDDITFTYYCKSKESVAYEIIRTNASHTQAEKVALMEDYPGGRLGSSGKKTPPFIVIKFRDRTSAYIQYDA